MDNGIFWAYLSHVMSTHTIPGVAQMSLISTGHFSLWKRERKKISLGLLRYTIPEFTHIYIFHPNAIVKLDLQALGI